MEYSMSDKLVYIIISLVIMLLTTYVTFYLGSLEYIDDRTTIKIHLIIVNFSIFMIFRKFYTVHIYKSYFYIVLLLLFPLLSWLIGIYIIKKASLVTFVTFIPVFLYDIIRYFIKDKKNDKEPITFKRGLFEFFMLIIFAVVSHCVALFLLVMYIFEFYGVAIFM